MPRIDGYGKGPAVFCIVLTLILLSGCASRLPTYNAWPPPQARVRFDGHHVFTIDACTTMVGRALLDGHTLVVGDLLGTGISCPPELIAANLELAKFLHQRPTLQQRNGRWLLVAGKRELPIQRTDLASKEQTAKSSEAD